MKIKICFKLFFTILFSVSFTFSIYLTPPVDRSPFGTDIHLWNTRGASSYNNDWIPYDDGIDDGYTNSKIFKLIPEMGARWVKDYGQSDGHMYYWPEDPKCGYPYMDSYVQTARHFNVKIMHTAMGFSSADTLRGLAPDNWEKFFRLQKEAVARYRDTIRFYIAGHEVDNIDGNCRWIDTLKNYVKYLKYVHDAVKSVEPNIYVMMGDLAQAVGGNDAPWNDGKFMYGGGDLNYVDERTLEKVIYEIKTNGNNPEYDTTIFGGFPPSTDPRDYFDGIAFNAYHWLYPIDKQRYDTFINYTYSTLQENGLEKEIDIFICETGPIYNLDRRMQAFGLIDEYIYLLRSGKISKICYFHFDGISSEPGSCRYEADYPYNMIEYDPNRDCVFATGEEIAKHPVWYAYKKMTHLVFPHLEEFEDDEFIEPEHAGSEFYFSGWQINNFSTWTINGGNFTAVTGDNANIVFRDLVLPSWRWRENIRTYDWQRHGINRYFTVRMKATQNSTATLYWDNVSERGGTNFTQQRSQSFDVTGDNQFHVYNIDLSSNTYYSGIITSVKFTPTEVPGETVVIDYLGFTDNPQTPQELYVSVYPEVLPPDGKSISWILVSLNDDKGKPVDISSVTVSFTLNGPGTLIGSTTPQMIYGSAGVVYKAGTTPGESATIHINTDGFTEKTVSIYLRTNQSPLPATGLKVNSAVNPSNLKDFKPLLSWTFNDPDISDEQYAFRILVSSDISLLNENYGSVWDSGKIISTAGSVRYGGSQLQVGLTYYWKVMTWDILDSSGPYSTEDSHFTMTATPPQETAVFFDGINDNVNFGSANSLNIHSGNASGLTVEFWIKPETYSGKMEMLVSRYSWDIGGFAIWMWDNNIRVYEFPEGGFECNSARISPGKWHHIAVQFGTDKRLFVDGRYKEVTSTSTAMPGSCTATLFAGGDSGYYFKGAIDELRISNVVRYTSNFIPPVKFYIIDSNTAGLWHFDEGEGTTTADETENNNTGILSNGATWTQGYMGIPELLLNTNFLNFGNVKIGEKSKLSFTITNNGAGTLSGTITPEKNWIVVSTGGFILEGGIPGLDEINVEVTVDNSILKMKKGDFSGRIFIESNAGSAEVNVTLTATCVLVKPNPFNPEISILEFYGSGIIPGKTIIRIYTITGELIKEIKGEVFQWDGKDAKDRQVASGIYLYTYETPVEKGISKFTVIK